MWTTRWGRAGLVLALTIGCEAEPDDGLEDAGWRWGTTTMGDMSESSDSSDPDEGWDLGNGDDADSAGQSNPTTYCGGIEMANKCVRSISGKVQVGISVPGVVTTGVTHEVTSTGTSTTSYSCTVCGSTTPPGAAVLCQQNHEYKFAHDAACKATTKVQACYKTSNGFTFNAGFLLPPGSGATVTRNTATEICLSGTGTAARTFEQACQFGEFTQWCEAQTPITSGIAQSNLDAIIAAHGVTGPADFCMEDDECLHNQVGMRWRCVDNRCLLRSELGETCTPADEARNNFRPWCREDEPLTCACTGWGLWRSCVCEEDGGE
ncbi:MAG: hypothetical protein AAF721_04290 [Myxococcota bacterium]